MESREQLGGEKVLCVGWCCVLREKKDRESGREVVESCCVMCVLCLFVQESEREREMELRVQVFECNEVFRQKMRGGI